MKKTLFIILSMMIVIAACSTPAPTLPAPAVSTQAPVASQPTLAPAGANTTAPQATAKVTKAISTEFTPSNPKTVKLNAGKPQLVEFFAFW